MLRIVQQASKLRPLILEVVVTKTELCQAIRLWTILSGLCVCKLAQVLLCLLVGTNQFSFEVMQQVTVELMLYLTESSHVPEPQSSIKCPVEE